MSALFLLPFLVLWLSPFSANLHKSVVGIDELASSDPGLPLIFQILHDYGHWAAVLLICIVVVGFIWQAISLWRTKKSFRKALDSTFSLFARKSDKDTVTQTIRDGDPTKYEFHQIFTEILALVQKADRRVVIVFDNIDRLPNDLIQETWSSVRSIFSRDGHRDKPPEAVVTALVPYDRAHVISAFENKETNSNNISVNNNEDIKLNYGLEDVFRKTFSAVITVAPPVNSDVDAFFAQCLEKALPKQFDDGQKYRLFQIFDVFLNERVSNPTPRQVKSFVNDVGMLWYQWKGAISIEAIAIFILHRTKLEAEPRSLQNPETIHARFRHFAPASNLDSELAALAYNVEPANALEILLHRDIVAGLRNYKSDRLIELSSSPGFKQQLDHILSKECTNWASTSLEDFKTALTNYSDLSLEPSIQELCNRHFIDAISKMATIDLLSWKDHKPLFHIIACSPKTSLVENMQKIAKWVKESIPKEPKEEVGRAWINFIGRFIQEAQNIHGEEIARLIPGAITIPYTANFYIGVALDCDEVDLNFSQFSNIAKSKSTEITTELIPYIIENPSFFSFLWHELNYAITNSDRATIFSKLTEQIQNNLLEESGDRQTYFENLALAAANISNQADTPKTIKTTISDGSLPWHAFKAHEEEDWKTVAIALWLTHLAVKSDNIPTLSSASKPPFGDVSAPHSWFSKFYTGAVPNEVLKILTGLVIEFSNVEEWLSTLIKSPKNALYKGVLNGVFSSNDCPALNFKALNHNYVNLRTHFQPEVIDAMVKRVGCEITIEQIDQISLDEVPSELIKDIAGLEIPSWVALLNRVDRHLKSISSAEWEKALNSDDRNRQLLFARGADLNGDIPPNNLRAPLADFVSGAIIERDTAAINLDNHDTFWTALPISSRKGVSTDVFERIADKPVASEGLKAAMSAFPELFAELPLEGRPETAVSKILIPLLTDDPVKALEFVNSKPLTWASCVAEVSTNMRSQLNDYFDGHNIEEHHATLDELRKNLKLRKPKRKLKPDTTDGDSEKDITE